jgi:hypothetical protein
MRTEGSQGILYHLVSERFETGHLGGRQVSNYRHFHRPVLEGNSKGSETRNIFACMQPDVGRRIFDPSFCSLPFKAARGVGP